MTETKMSEDTMPISTGLVYVNKESGEEVVPFLVEPSGNVMYAPVGSAREVRTDAASFRDTFEISEDRLNESEEAQAAAEKQHEEEPAHSFASADTERKATGDGTSVDGEPTKAEPKSTSNKKERK